MSGIVAMRKLQPMSNIFDTSAEAWTVVRNGPGNAGAAHDASSFGAALNRFVVATDELIAKDGATGLETNASRWMFQSPPAYSGNQGASYKGSLEFTLGALAGEEVNVERMKNAELFRVLWLILGPQEGPSKKELEQQRWAAMNRSSADKRASRASRGSGDDNPRGSRSSGDAAFGRGSRSSGDEMAGGLFLTVPLVLCRVWTLKELKELCKRPPPEPEKKKRIFTFTRAAKPKYGRAGDDFGEGEGGLT